MTKVNLTFIQALYKKVSHFVVMWTKEIKMTASYLSIQHSKTSAASWSSG